MKRIIYISIILLSTQNTFSMLNQAKILYHNVNKSLIDAVKNNDIEKIKELISIGVDLNIQDNVGRTAIYHAVWEKNKNIIKILIDAGSNVDQQDLNRSNPLMKACCNQNDDTEIVEMLINAKANLDIIGHNNLETALHWADTMGNGKIVNVLVKAGANLNLKYNKGHTILMSAGLSCKNDLVNLLLDSGADINLKNDNNKTALQLAREAKRNEVVKILIDKVNIWKQEAIKSVKNNDFNNFKKYILKIGTICFKDENGNNLLHHAFMSQNIELGKRIHFINPELISQANNIGQTPVDFIISQNSGLDFIKKLLEF